MAVTFGAMTWKQRLLCLSALAVAVSVLLAATVLRNALQAVTVFRQQRQALHALSVSDTFEGSLHFADVEKRILPDTTALDVKRDSMLGEIIKYCDGKEVRIVSIGKTNERDVSNFRIQQSAVSVAGPFVDLVKCVHHLEKVDTFGQVVSVNFYTDPIREPGQTKVICNIVFENVSKLQHP